MRARSPRPRATFASTWTGSPTLDPGEPPALDPERHYLEGAPEDVARLHAHARLDQLRVGLVPDAAQAAGDVGLLHGGVVADGLLAVLRWVVGRRTAGIEGGGPGGGVRAGPGSRAHGPLRRGAARPRPLPRCPSLARAGRRGRRLGRAARLDARRRMPFFDDVGFWKRAQIVPNDLALAGVAEFDDLDRLTIFADNLVPHVLRVDGVLRLRPGAGGTDRRRRAAAAGRRGARDPRLRGARLRAAGGAPRYAGRAYSTWRSGPRARRRSTRPCRGTAPGRSSTSRLRCPGRRGAGGGAPRRLGLRPVCSATSSSSSFRRLARPLIASATGSGRWTQSASGPSGFLPSTRTGWPGLPTTVEFGGTSWMTTELAPIFDALSHHDRA